jgi:hypothetical protein
LLAQHLSHEEADNRAAPPMPLLGRNLLTRHLAETGEKNQLFE